jgi:hypothetical protein
VNKLYILFACALLASCGPSVNTTIATKYPPLDSSESVRVIPIDDQAPQGAINIGTVKIGDTGFSTNCGWDVVIARARDEARKAGGNAIKITEYIPPSLFGSSCDRITALILKIDVSAASATAKASASRDSIIPVKSLDSIKKVNNDYEHFRLGVSGGYSHILAQTADGVAPQIKEHLDALKSGMHFGADANYFVSKEFGMGLKYSMFLTREELENVTYINNIGAEQTGTLIDDITIQYIGPTFSTQYTSDSKKTRLNGEFSVGYLQYTNNASLGSEYTISGGTVGFVAELGVEFVLSKAISVGINLGVTAGSLSEFEIKDEQGTREVTLEGDQRENITRLDVGAMFKWSF